MIINPINYEDLNMATLQPSGCLLKDVVSLELMFQLLLNCFFTIHYSLGRFHNNFTGPVHISVDCSELIMSS